MKTILIIVGTAAVTGTAVWLVMTPDAISLPVASEKISEQQVEVFEQTQTITAKQEGVAMLSALFMQDADVACSFKTQSNVEQSEGTLWYSNDRLAVEALTRVDGELYASNLINSNDRLYVWSGTASGMMAMVLPAPATIAKQLKKQGELASAGPGIDYSQTVQYECEPWQPNELRFIPPGDIEFVDMEAVMQGVFEGELRGVPEGMDIP